MGANSALLSLQESVLDQIEKLSCGPPGAVHVLFKLLSGDRDRFVGRDSQRLSIALQRVVGAAQRCKQNGAIIVRQ